MEAAAEDDDDDVESDEDDGADDDDEDDEAASSRCCGVCEKGSEERLAMSSVTDLAAALPASPVQYELRTV